MLAFSVVRQKKEKLVSSKGRQESKQGFRFFVLAEQIAQEE
jgi:hypothetical protein